jgi:hypothetical protein
MDPEEQKLIGALVAADKAGDTKSAQIFADLLRKRRAVNPNAPNPITTAVRESQAKETTKFANQARDFQYIPTGMGVAPPSNLMRTPQGLYVENPEFEKPQDTLEDYGRTAAYAAAPYLAAAAGGAPIGGVGALGGMGLLAAGDLGVNLYNLAATPFGAPRGQTPSELIRNTLVTVAPDYIAPPQTSGQRTLFSGIDVGLGTLGGGALARQASQAFTRPNTLSRNVLETMAGGSPAVNLAAGGGAGVAGQLAQEMNAPPAVRLGAELLGGLATGGTAAATTRRDVSAIRPTQAALTQQAENLKDRMYAELKASGLRYRKADVRALINSFEQRVNSGQIQGVSSAPPEFRAALSQARNRLTNSPNVSDAEVLREVLSTFNANAAAGQMPVLAREFRNLLDDFMLNPANSIAGRAASTPAEIVAAQAATNQQNALRRQAAEANALFERARQIDPVLNRVENAVLAGAEPVDAIRSNLRNLANNTQWQRYASEEQQNALRRAISGDLSQQVLEAIGRVSPGRSGPGGWVGKALTAAGFTTTGFGLINPLLYAAPVLATGFAAGTGAARRAANTSAETQLNRLAEYLKTGVMPEKPPTSRFGRAAISATTQAATRPDETEAMRVERERAKPKEKQLILGAPKTTTEVQRMTRVARDILADPEYAKKYKLAEIAQLYRTLYNASEEGYSDVGDLADQIADFHEARYAFEQGTKR